MNRGARRATIFLADDHCAKFLTENGIRATFAVPSGAAGKTLENRPVIDIDELREKMK